MAVETVLPSILEFYDNVYGLTDYDDKQDADAVWSKMRSDLPGITDIECYIIGLKWKV